MTSIGSVNLSNGMPVAAVGGEFIAVERRFVADDDAVVFRVQFDHINRLGRGDAQAFALADGVKLNAVVMAEDVAVQIHDFAAMLLHEVRRLEKAAVIVVRHEADFHALLLVGGLELAMPRHFARVALGLFAERKNRPRQLVLPQREKEITLVLLQIASALEQITPGAPTSVGADSLSASATAAGCRRSPLRPFHSRKMSRGNEIRAELVRAVNEPAEFQILIAHHARIRRAAGLVFVGKVLDDVLLEFRRLVNEIIRDVELVADGARVGDGLRAAAFVLRAVHAILRPELERDADDLVALLEQQRRRGGGINSPAHAADDALTLLRIHRGTLYNARAACKMVCEASERKMLLHFLNNQHFDRHVGWHQSRPASSSSRFKSAAFCCGSCHWNVKS